MPSGKRRRAPASPWQGSLRVGLAFGLLIALNTYFIFLRHGTSVQTLLARARSPQLLLVAPSPHPPARKLDTKEQARFCEGTVRAGESLGALAQSHGFAARDARLVEALFAHQPEAPLLPGDGWEVRYDSAERANALTIRRSKRLAVVIERAGDGFTAAHDVRLLDIRRAEVSTSVGVSLTDAIVRAGERPLLAGTLLDVFAGELDYPADVQPTDRFTVVVEKLFLDGVFARYGRVLGAEWVGRTAESTRRAFWFAGGYYTEHGESAERLWRKSPIAANPAASTKERHRAPLLHVTAQGRWVEYFAPAGAEVVALRAGRVAFVGAGAGAPVTLMHDDGMQTQYRRLARHVPLRNGQLIRAGQTLGWLGAVQPSLQLTLLQAGASIDPLEARAPRLPPLDNDRRSAFADVVAPCLSEMAALH